MQVALEITFRGVETSPYVQDLVRQRAARLEEFCDHINSCRVALERPNAHPKAGSPWRVRLDMTVKPGHEIVVDRKPMNGNIRDTLYDAVNDAFDIAQRRLKRLNQKQHGDVKLHPEQMATGVIDKLVDDYGFILSVDGRHVYFHSHSVLHEAPEALEVGMAVAFTEENGEQGPQASTVRVVDHRHAPHNEAVEPTT